MTEGEILANIKHNMFKLKRKKKPYINTTKYPE